MRLDVCCWPTPHCRFAYATSQHRSVPAPYPVLLHASIRFLEVQFRDWVSEHLGKARIGGTPGIANHLRAFIREIVFRQRYPSFSNGS